MEPRFAEARPIASLDAEVCFLLKDSFYYGPDKLPEVTERKLVVPVALPDIPRQAPLLLRTGEAAGHERQLAGYFEQIVRLAEQHQMPFARIRHYFWLRLWLWNSAENVPRLVSLVRHVFRDRRLSELARRRAAGRGLRRRGAGLGAGSACRAGPAVGSGRGPGRG